MKGGEDGLPRAGDWQGTLETGTRTIQVGVPPHRAAVNTILWRDRAAVPGPDDIVAKVPQGAAVLVEILLAEVPENYRVNQQSMTKEILWNRKDVTVVSAPKLITQSGREGKVEIGQRAKGRDPAGPLQSGLSFAVTPVLKGEEVDSSMSISKSEADRAGVVRKQLVEMRLRAALSKWTGFEVGPMKGGRKTGGLGSFYQGGGRATREWEAGLPHHSWRTSAMEGKGVWPGCR